MVELAKRLSAMTPGLSSLSGCIDVEDKRRRARTHHERDAGTKKTCDSDVKDDENHQDDLGAGTVDDKDIGSDSSNHLKNSSGHSDIENGLDDHLKKTKEGAVNGSRNSEQDKVSEGKKHVMQKDDKVDAKGKAGDNKDTQGYMDRAQKTEEPLEKDIESGKSPASEHTDAHSVDHSHAEHFTSPTEVDAKQTLIKKHKEESTDEIVTKTTMEDETAEEQARREADTVNMQCKLEVDDSGRFVLTGTWHFQESVLGKVSYLMEKSDTVELTTSATAEASVQPSSSSSSSSSSSPSSSSTLPASNSKANSSQLAAQTSDSLAGQTQAVGGPSGPGSSTSAEKGNSKEKGAAPVPQSTTLDSLPENTECVWSGSFTMANPAHVERKKKRRSTKKVLSVPEKFLVTFVPCAEAGSTILSVDGVGRNRFGRFTLKGSLDRKTGEFTSDKAYLPREAALPNNSCGNNNTGCSNSSVNGDRTVGRKWGRSDEIEFDRCLNGVRASKRQRVPNRMLMLDTSKRSYVLIAKHGKGAGRPSSTPVDSISMAAISDGHLTPATAAIAFNGGFLSPDLSADAKVVFSDGTLGLPQPFDQGRSASIRKKAHKATVALVRQLIRDQRSVHKQHPRRSSSSSSSITGASSVASSSAGTGSLVRCSSSVSQSVPLPFYTAEEAAAMPDTFKTGAGQIYEGEFDDLGRRHGYGICLLENGMIYEGLWAGGKMYGKGLLMNACGELIYQGEFADNTMSGRGTYLFESGDRYDGEFREGRFHGHGIYFHAASGGTFVGDWRRGFRHGVGDLFMPDGSGYSGDWSKDQWCGRGILNVKDVCYYDGQFRDHRFDGRGECSYGTHGNFAGAYRGGVKEGRGTYSFSNGAVYEGRFRGDGIEGFGTLKMTNDRAEQVGESTWFLPITCQSEMRYVHRAAGF